MPFFKNFLYITEDFQQRIENRDMVSLNPSTKEELEIKPKHLRQITVLKPIRLNSVEDININKIREESSQYFKSYTER